MGQHTPFFLCVGICVVDHCSRYLFTTKSLDVFVVFRCIHICLCSFVLVEVVSFLCWVQPEVSQGTFVVQSGFGIIKHNSVGNLVQMILSSAIRVKMQYWFFSTFCSFRIARPVRRFRGSAGNLGCLSLPSSVNPQRGWCNIWRDAQKKVLVAFYQKLCGFLLG